MPDARRACVFFALFLLISSAWPASAFRVAGIPGAWTRWDASPRYVQGVERSLDGGLRYSIETGSYQGLRDQFIWVPGCHPLPTSRRQPNGLSSTGRSSTLRLGCRLASISSKIYRLPISGADIRINPAFVWSLSGFEVLLTHEIGHALGLSDLEGPSGIGGGSGFFDDNFDPSTSLTASQTLKNSFALDIDPYDPDDSPLFELFGDMNMDPGLDSPGVELLMETESIFEPTEAAPFLQNDEFAARLFLYAVAVPQPAFPTMILLGLGALCGAAWRRERRLSP